MGRLSRAEQQERNRAKVLTAAGKEFAERGFPGSTVDGIAERAGLTRGAVYSNFPGKRALYFAVLADLAEHAAGVSGEAPGPAVPERTARETLAALARVWVARLPLTEPDMESAARKSGRKSTRPARLGMHVLPEVLAGEDIRRPYAQLMKLDAILLGLALEALRRPDTPRARLVRTAEAVLTLLHGARQLADGAPGFMEPFHIISACEHLAALELDDAWPPPHLSYVSQARPADEPWSPPVRAVDAVRGGPARLGDDGVVAILGLHRLEAAEEAVRAAPPGTTVTAVLTSRAPGELLPLARLTVAELSGCLRQAFPPSAWPRLQVVYDESGALAEAAGVPVTGDDTEAAVRIEAGRIVARAKGRGACHAAATAAEGPVRGGGEAEPARLGMPDCGRNSSPEQTGRTSSGPIGASGI